MANGGDGGVRPCERERGYARGEWAGLVGPEASWAVAQWGRGGSFSFSPSLFLSFLLFLLFGY